MRYEHLGFSLFIIVSIFIISGASGQPRHTPAPVSAAVMNEQRLRAEAISEKYNLGWYGNWCGGGHGGYQDCCNGTACPACVTDVPDECNAGESENWAKCRPTKECAKRFRLHFPRAIPRGTTAGAIVTWWQTSLLIQAFDYTLACWAYPTGNWTGAPYCNGVINRKQPVSQYCTAATN
ncbi:uncharacterized protein ACA1_310790 [Acanthamoeba castellanii str. Neff]|uniref:Uncharacterized protein n=1 Tax=Acanthamoeba castellanii (strain ATCC 30010 / Neff) TaxID=1257118 RepID=L8GTB8_ACACF|nr:uncharacterized protein ACA1_310790 [Acanthamoeba castellanii str. Neff]ELR16250.1 hypothetical protein ACA1_310790 [Acanthamoeba castellanii str. Neff]